MVSFNVTEGPVPSVAISFDIYLLPAGGAVGGAAGGAVEPAAAGASVR